jgi:patatin-like phospholipase/acyl hydrolase
MPNYLILACDGGGMRGYLSSLLLQQLNKELKIFGTSNQGIDLYAGTSTGGLIALALAQGTWRWHKVRVSTALWLFIKKRAQTSFILWIGSGQSA